MIDISKLKTLIEVRNMMTNTRKHGRHDLYEIAFRRLVELQAKKHDDPVCQGFWRGIAAVEELLRQEHGKAVKANRSRQKAGRVGEVVCLTDWAMRKGETKGFVMLVEAGMGDETGEYVVAAHPDRFPADAVAMARHKLLARSVSLPVAG